MYDKNKAPSLEYLLAMASIGAGIGLGLQNVQDSGFVRYALTYGPMFVGAVATEIRGDGALLGAGIGGFYTLTGCILSSVVKAVVENL